ncbi:hypothetical protein B0H99_101400 [Planomicrobium soli]|uniref:Uncharacterized protein n=1 Tax=Planomicrobium soli TaxID=1176648 RepID=A0A2P8H7F8_9BACL|nr:hypothetical protein [Planomicrobium soli]PSL42152.1 hypothetical protein B0H99_101400 [Planomicrobium soli]
MMLTREQVAIVQEFKEKYGLKMLLEKAEVDSSELRNKMVLPEGGKA